MQNSEARLVTARRESVIILPILRCLDWLPVRYKIIFKILLLTYKVLNGQAPSYIKDLLKYKNSGRVLRSSNKHLLYEPVAKLKPYDDGAYSRVSMGLTERRKTAKNLADSRKIEKV